MNRRTSMKTAVVALFAALVTGAFSAVAAEAPLRTLFNETAEAKARRMAWWTHDRFGMFIHFGLYAMPARQEWIRHIEHITDEDYRKYFDRFDPDRFDAREWARTARKAGMRYIVLTAKHHEGFCLFDSKYTDYKITNTPFGRDLVKEFAEACRAEGLRVGLYYSLIDWHHPDFTIDRLGPYRDLPADRKAERNRGRDMSRYRQYMKDQVVELMTNYGTIDIVWFDFSYPGKDGKGREDWDSEGLLRLVRKLNPNVIVDNRLDLLDTTDGWDFITPEQYKMASWPTLHGRRAPWETCQTFSGSWGYHRDESTWKSVPQLISLLVDTVAHGGNLILNVGPTGRGRFDRRATERLEAIGRWMDDNSRSIYGCTEPPPGFEAPSGTALTYNPETRRLYVHLYTYPMGFLPVAFWEKIAYAQFLHDASEVLVRPPSRRNESVDGKDGKECGGFQLPVLEPAVEVPVIEAYLR